MKLSLELKGIILGTVSGLAAVSIALAAGEIIRPKATAASGAKETLVIPPAGTQEHQGHTLFMMNCAHCHGNDARGDEGPDLHGVTKSDARISSLIKNGIKGEMPKFGAKLTDADVQALIAFVRSLKDKGLTKLSPGRSARREEAGRARGLCQEASEAGLKGERLARWDWPVGPTDIVLLGVIYLVIWTLYRVCAFFRKRPQTFS